MREAGGQSERQEERKSQRVCDRECEKEWDKERERGKGRETVVGPARERTIERQKPKEIQTAKKSA